MVHVTVEKICAVNLTYSGIKVWGSAHFLLFAVFALEGISLVTKLLHLQDITGNPILFEMVLKLIAIF